MNRYYDSVHGRFDTKDRYQADSGTQSAATWNRYAYVHGDPVTPGNPRGLWECRNCGDAGSPECQIGYHWDPFTGFCRPDSPGITSSSGGDNHPADPVCSISRYERPVGVPGVGALAAHTYLLVQNPSGTSTIEGGPDLVSSNSFTYTLLSDIGLAGYFGPTIGWTPGWGQLVPGLQ